MSAPLLVELLCEELPPKALARLGAAFGEHLVSGLKSRGLVTKEASHRIFATPRRLAVLIDVVLPRASDAPIDERLMPSKVAFDADGKPTAALQKRLGKLGREGLLNSPNFADGPDELVRRSEGGAEYVYLKSLALGQPIQRALDESLKEAIENLPIPKLMTYQLADGVTDVSFVRPAHSLVSLHGEAVVAVSALGLDSGRTTRGHRFQGANRLDIARADDYERALAEEGGVIACFARRRDEILAQLERAAKAEGATLGPEADRTALLDEVTSLVEMPTVYTGTFEPEFLAVPAECLVLTMRQNQKYFPLFDAAGKLTNRFLIVSNMRLDDPLNIVQGNERVVRPRLADARFFFETDKKTRLASRVPQLGSIVHHNKLGTQLQRVDRLVNLATKIQEGLPRGTAGVEWAVRAAYLAKADLVTLMVGEFPELQGLMGRYYADADGEPPSVGRAIEQHYWPRFSGDALPTGDASIAVALADRLDSLVGMFSIGQVPTGDKDPFALRRAALGIVRILMETTPALKADLSRLVAAAADTLGVPKERKPQVVGAVLVFVSDRMANLMKERGYTANEVAAVLEVQGDESMPGRLDLVPLKLQAVREFGKLPEAAALAAANKRIQNILRKSDGFANPDFEVLVVPEEKALLASLVALQLTIKDRFAAGDYTGALTALAGLREDVDAFFDTVLVNAEDPKLRAARLGLLDKLGGVMNQVADISKLSA